jgi:hypothetical protein
MTRAWLALLPALVGACTGTRAASTPWVVQPEGAAACSPEATANESCYPSALLAPPVVVGPGRIQVLTQGGLSGRRPFDPRNVREQLRFFIDEITRSGHQPLASGICPGRLGISEATTLVRLPSGETGVLCLEPGQAEGCRETTSPGCFDVGPGPCRRTRCGVTFAHFGVVDRAQQSIVWRWRSAHSHDLDRDTVRVAAFGDGAAVIYRQIDDPARQESWIVALEPNGKAFEVRDDDDIEEEGLAAVLVADGKLHLILRRGEYDRQYRQLVIERDGTRTSNRLDQTGRLTPGPLGEICLAEGADGSVTLSLPYRNEGEIPPYTPGRILTLRYRNAIVPDGPDVTPSTRAACGPRIAADDARWARATFDDTGPLIVYTTFDQDRRPASLHVDRHAR